MKEKLLQAYNNNKLIGIYDDFNHPDSFTVGYVLSIDNNSYIVCELTPNGEFDAYLCRFFDDIFKITEDTKYLDCIKKLVDYNKTKIDKNIFTGRKENIFQFLDYIIENQKICTIVTYNEDISDIVGFVEEYDKNSVKILVIDEYGFEDGIIQVELDVIKSLECCCKNEIKLEILYGINKKI